MQLTPREKDKLLVSMAAMVARRIADAWLAQARYQQSIINAISRPAEGKPWKDYRPIFMNAARIDQGRTFYAENRSAVDAIAAERGALDELRARAATAAAAAARGLIADQHDAKADRKLVDEAIAGI